MKEINKQCYNKNKNYKTKILMIYCNNKILIYYVIHHHLHVVLILINMNFIVFIIYSNQKQLILLNLFKCYKELEYHKKYIML